MQVPPCNSARVLRVHSREGLEKSHNYRVRQECQPASHEVGLCGPGRTRIPRRPVKNNSSEGSQGLILPSAAADVSYCYLNNSKTHSPMTSRRALVSFWTRWARRHCLDAFGLALQVCLERKLFSVLKKLDWVPPSLNFKRTVRPHPVWDDVALVCFPSLDVGSHHRPKEINMIGQIASMGSAFPLLYDLSLSIANSGSSHWTPDCINTLYRTHIEGLRAEVAHAVNFAQLPF